MGIYCKNADRCSYHPSGACDLIFDCVCFEAAVGQGLQSTAKKTVTQMLTAKEAEEQEAFVRWCELNGIPVFHIPNEGKRTKGTGGRLKAQGLSQGVPDLMIPVPSGGKHGLFIEMKRPKPMGKRPTDTQLKWLELLNKNGYLAVVCYGQDEAKETLKTYFCAKK